MKRMRKFALSMFIFMLSGISNLNAEENRQVQSDQTEVRPAENKKVETDSTTSVKPTDKPADLIKSESEKQINNGVEANKNEMVADKNEGSDSEKKHTGYVYQKYSSFGINISSHSGVGLSYRFHMDTPFLFELSGGVVSSGKTYFYAVGGEIQRELSKSKDKRAFGAFAVGFYGERYEKNDYDAAYYSEMEPPKKWTSDNAFTFALGVGGELALSNLIVDAISIGCEIYPIGVYVKNNGENEFNMFPGGAIYLYYNF